MLTDAISYFRDKVGQFALGSLRIDWQCIHLMCSLYLLYHVLYPVVHPSHLMH